MRQVAVVSFAQAPQVRRELELNEVEILMPVVREAISGSGIPKDELDFICSGSCDYLAGQPFSFVLSLDAVGAWPPVCESHVEMDGAWALYEAWLKIQTGQADTALVYAFGKSSLGDLPEVMALQLDPYTVTPLWPDAVSLAALQARALLESGGASERDLAEVVVRARRHAKSNPHAQLAGDFEVEKLLGEPRFVSPLRRHDCAPITDGAAALVLAAGDRARSVCQRPAWIRGLDHRVDPQDLGLRDLTRCESAEISAAAIGLDAGALDLAELHAPFSSQEIILARALGLTEAVTVNPSGGPLCGNPMMAAGLIRIGEAARAVQEGRADRALAHATSGPCLQQNLLCLLEGDA